MKTNNLTALVLATGLLSTAAIAEDSSAAAPPAPAPARIAPATSAPTQVIYTPQLPNVAELTKAAAQSLAIKFITQTAREVSVTYQFANGQTKVVSYRLLADALPSQAPVAAPPVTYMMAPPAGYYYDPYYSPYGYPPLSLRFGLGFGFRGGRRW